MFVTNLYYIYNNGFSHQPQGKTDFWSFLWVYRYFLLNELTEYGLIVFKTLTTDMRKSLLQSVLWRSELYFKQRNTLDLKYGKKLYNPSFSHSSKHILQQLSSSLTNILFHMSSVLFCSSGGLPQQCLPQTQHPATVCSSNFPNCLSLIDLEIMFCLYALRRIFLLLTVGITDKVLRPLDDNNHCVLKFYFSWIKRQICTWSEVISLVFRQIRPLVSTDLWKWLKQVDLP